ncbi:unnamed protein product [Staurois parvus]|uniref:Uncharacterized protein n=1 Tax=Staurois parvus TaxID=386267 RepID=A0ABN9BAM3_9NEOB|nr:unnamed protein product [Staurois parvus]
MTNFPTNHYHSILQVVLIYYRFSIWSKTAFDLKGRFLDAMDISQFPGRKNSQNAGRAQDKALGTKCM